MTCEPDLQRPAIRAALAISSQLSLVRNAPADANLPHSTWQRLSRTFGLLQLATFRQWAVASRDLIEDLDSLLNQLEIELRGVRRELTSRLRPRHLSSAGDVYADLLALASEFEELTIDLQQRTISVQTEPIELEGTDLGRFRIELKWPDLGGHRAYRVRGVDPTSATGSREVTHPHVRNDELCEGDGSLAIAAALAEGRLLEFFLLVRQVLETYNPDSAFIPLDRWDGVNCQDCGDRMPADEAGNCDRCECPLCHDCSIGCDRCHAYVCNGCSSLCEACESSHCTSCLTNESGRLLCDTCLEEARAEESEDDAEDDITIADAISPEPTHLSEDDDAHEDNHDTTDNSEDDNPDPEPGTPVRKTDAAPAPDGQIEEVATLAQVHSLCLVEAAVPA